MCFFFLFVNDYQTKPALSHFLMDNFQTYKLPCSHNFSLPKNMTHNKFLCTIYLTRSIGFPGGDIKFICITVSPLCFSRHGSSGGRWRRSTMCREMQKTEKGFFFKKKELTSVTFTARCTCKQWFSKKLWFYMSFCVDLRQTAEFWSWELNMYCKLY